MRIIPFFIFLLFFFNGFTQYRFPTVYLDEEGYKLSDSTDYVYSRIIAKVPGVNYLITEYYRSGKMRCKGYSSDSLGYDREGPFVYYYESGVKSSLITYSEGDKLGQAMRWYPNGNKHSQFEYYDKKSEVFKLINSWDSVGNILVENGNGIYFDFHLNGKIKSKALYKNFFHDEYWNEYDTTGTLIYRDSLSEHKFICGIRYLNNGEEVKYTQESIEAEYPGGLMKMYEYLSKNMRYPSDARSKAIQGKVYIQFTINVDGSITNVKVLKGPSADLKEEAIRVVKSMPKWKPAYFKGAPVKVVYNLPIVFKLTKN